MRTDGAARRARDRGSRARRDEDLWYLEHGWRTLARSRHCNSVVVRWTVREHGVPLAGEHPATLVDPIPVETLRAEIAGTIRDWGREILDAPERFANRFYQGFIVLSYCRMLHDLRAGSTGSKRTGAEWAKATLDPAWIGWVDAHLLASALLSGSRLWSLDGRLRDAAEDLGLGFTP